MSRWRNWIDRIANAGSSEDDPISQTSTETVAGIENGKPVMTDGGTSDEDDSDEEERTQRDTQDDDVTAAGEAFGSAEVDVEVVVDPDDTDTPTEPDDGEVPAPDKARELLEEMNLEEKKQVAGEAVEQAVQAVSDEETAGTAEVREQQKDIIDDFQHEVVGRSEESFDEEEANRLAREAQNRDVNRTYGDDEALDEERFLDNRYGDDVATTVLKTAVVDRLTEDSMSTASLANQAGANRSLGEVPTDQYEHQLVMEAIENHENFSDVAEADAATITSLIEYRASTYGLADDVAAATEDEIRQTVQEEQMAPTQAKKDAISAEDRRLLRDYDRLLTDMDSVAKETADTIDQFYDEEVRLGERLQSIEQEMAEMLGHNGLLHEITIDLRLDKNQGFSNTDEYKPSSESGQRLDQWYDALNQKMDRLGDGFSSSGMLDDIVDAANRFDDVIETVDQYDDDLSVDQPDQMADHERLDTFAAEVRNRSSAVSQYTNELTEAVDAGYLQTDDDGVSLTTDVRAVATYTQEIVDAWDDDGLNAEDTYERVAEIVSGDYQAEVGGVTADPLPDVGTRLG